MRLALRLLYREWRSGEISIMFVALIIAIAMSSGLSSISQRMQSGIEEHSRQFTAADSILRSREVIDPQWLHKARNMDLTYTRSVRFPSMLFNDTGQQLSLVKAIAFGYPLQGQLMIAQQLGGEQHASTTGPAPGEIWIDERLYWALDVDVGSSLYLGDATLLVSAILISDPDRGWGTYFMPQTIINIADLERTGLIEQHSRVDYSYYFSGRTAADYGQWIAPQLNASHRWIESGTTQSGLLRMVNRIQIFSLFIGAFAILIAGIAITSAIHYFNARHQQTIAVLKVLGITQNKLLWCYFSIFAILVVIAGVGGSFCAWGMQELLLTIATDYLPFAPGEMSLQPFIMGIAVVFICVGVMLIPSLTHIKSISPLQLLRRPIHPSKRKFILMVLCASCSFTALIYFYMRDIQLTAILIAGMMTLIATLALLAFVLFLSSTRLITLAQKWLLSIAHMRQLLPHNILFIAISAVSMMLILSLVLIRDYFITDMQAEIGAQRANYFILNIQPSVTAAMQEWMEEQHIQWRAPYPMARVRLEKVGEQDVRDTLMRHYNRDEVNLAAANIIPTGNKIIAGTWWDKSTTQQALISIEKSFADNIGIQLGDTLTLTVGERQMHTTVTSIRTVNWGSLTPNFFAIVPTAMIQGIPHTFMNSFYVPAEKKAQLMGNFIRKFPNVGLISVDQLIQQLNTSLRQMSQAMGVMLLCAFGASLLVTIITIRAGIAYRRHANALLIVLGASRKQILSNGLVEFMVMGLISGLLAIVGAEISIYLLQTTVFQLNGTWHPLLWFIAPLISMVALSAIGLAIIYPATRIAPISILRHS